MNGYISEIFSDIQGEGIFIGRRQIFLRLYGCNLRCVYCDTPDSLVPGKEGRVEETPGKRNFFKIINPISPSATVLLLENFWQFPHHCLALTGGEPLVQKDFLKQLLPQIYGVQVKILLETNGVLYKELEEVLPYIDYISMDIKLASSTGERNFFEEHKEFLKRAVEKEVYIKIVLTTSTTEDDFQEAVELIASVSNEIPLVLQPVSPLDGAELSTPQPPSFSQLLDFQALCLQMLKDVRIIPQIHPRLQLF